MSARAEQLQARVEHQVTELLRLLDAQTPDTLRRACGREKLGDGSLGALIAHTADNYQRISSFASGSAQAGPSHAAARRSHRVPGLLRALRHTRPDHGAEYAADATDPDRIAAVLTAARQALRPIAELTDEQLDAVPPAGSFRFCDGKRGLEEVLRALLNHQDRQLDAIRNAGG